MKTAWIIKEEEETISRKRVPENNFLQSKKTLVADDVDQGQREEATGQRSQVNVKSLN